MPMGGSVLYAPLLGIEQGGVRMEDRPNPDALLMQVERAEWEKQEQRGKLKIFFGYAAGVGKTYAMLKAAQQAKKGGADVVIGYLEPHARPEIAALAENLPRLPLREIRHKGIALHEFDLERRAQPLPRHSAG